MILSNNSVSDFGPNRNYSKRISEEKFQQLSDLSGHSCDHLRIKNHSQLYGSSLDQSRKYPLKNHLISRTTTCRGTSYHSQHSGSTLGSNNLKSRGTSYHSQHSGSTLDRSINNSGFISDQASFSGKVKPIKKYSGYYSSPELSSPRRIEKNSNYLPLSRIPETPEFHSGIPGNSEFHSGDSSIHSSLENLSNLEYSEDKSDINSAKEISEVDSEIHSEYNSGNTFENYSEIPSNLSGQTSEHIEFKNCSTSYHSQHSGSSLDQSRKNPLKNHLISRTTTCRGTSYSGSSLDLSRNPIHPKNQSTSYHSQYSESSLDQSRNPYHPKNQSTSYHSQYSGTSLDQSKSSYLEQFEQKTQKVKNQLDLLRSESFQIHSSSGEHSSRNSRNYKQTNFGNFLGDIHEVCHLLIFEIRLNMTVSKCS